MINPSFRNPHSSLWPFYISPSSACLFLMHNPVIIIFVLIATSRKGRETQHPTPNAQCPISGSRLPRSLPLHPTTNIIVPYHKCSQLCSSVDSTPQESSTRSIVVHIMLTYPPHSVPPTLPVQLPLANIAYQQNVQNRHKRETSYRV